MNILYISARGVLADGYIYKYYGDLYRELRQLENVYVYEQAISDINILLDRYENKIDCIIFGLGYFAQNNSNCYKEISGMKGLSIPKIALIHKPQTMLAEKLNFCKINDFDLFVDSQITYKKHAEIANCKPVRLPFAASPSIFYPRNVDKIYDIGFCGAMHGNGKIEGDTRDLRDRVHDKVFKLGHNVFWNGQRLPSDRIGSVEDYATKINQSKIWLSTTGPTLDVSPRYFEAMLSKTLLCCNSMPYQYENIFIDEVNCIMFENDLSDFDEKINYYLNNDEERNKIIENAYDMAINKYTWEHMAKKLIKEIGEI